MMAPALPPDALPTIVASAVEMNSALPSPHPARKPITASTEPLTAHSRLNTMMNDRPMSSVRLAPSRLDRKLVKSIIAPVITR